MTSMDMVPCSPHGALDRYIGYWKPYATSHLDLDADTAIQIEVHNLALLLLKAAQESRGRSVEIGELQEPRVK